MVSDLLLSLAKNNPQDFLIGLVDLINQYFILLDTKTALELVETYLLSRREQLKILCEINPSVHRAVIDLGFYLDKYYIPGSISSSSN